MGYGMPCIVVSARLERSGELLQALSLLGVPPGRAGALEGWLSHFTTSTTH
jgi:hypothetical protein